jgi:hypothetical protein
MAEWHFRECVTPGYFLRMAFLIKDFVPTPFRQLSPKIDRTCIFLEESDPLRHFYWRAEGGVASGNTLDLRAFLAFRHFMALAEGGSSLP